MKKYAKRKAELNKETVKSSETLTNMQDFLHEKMETVHMKVQKYMANRKALKVLNRDFRNDFVTL